jgi:hypothetical protein
MKRIAVVLAGLALVSMPLATASHAEVNVNVNVGVPAPPLPVLAPPVISLPAPPEFIMPPALGFYVAVGVPHDIFRIGTTYYLYRDGSWYDGRYYNGPWRHIERRSLPPGLRKHKYERIRYYRDEEYRRYRAEHEGYRGRHFKPDKEWKEERKEQRREEKERRKEEKRYEKEERRHDRGDGGGEGRGEGHGEGRGHGRH